MQRYLMLAAIVAALAPVAVAPAPVVAAGAHPCVDTIVSVVEPRLVGGGQTHFTQADYESGVQVVFNTTLGFAPPARAMVVHYGGDSDNALMMAEHRGDPVLVCLVTVPQASPGCNPSTDLRGRVFLVYDYRRNASYSGMNSEHDCGGA